MSSKYFCTECGHNHYYSSKIGKKHLKYKSQQRTIIKKIQQKEKNVPNQLEKNELNSKVELENSVKKEEIIEEKKSSNPLVRFIKDYQRSYGKGIEVYGVWWKVFQLSIWSIILIFLMTASIIFIVFLPKIDFINWILR